MLLCSPQVFGTERPYDVVHTPGETPVDLSLVPSGVTAALVLTELGNLMQARQLVKTLRQKNDEAAPIIVVLLMNENEGIPADLEPILQAQNEFFSDDADDVIYKTGTRAEFRLNVGMACVRSRFGNSARDQMEEELHAHYERKLQAKLKIADQEHRLESTTGMFWQTVHHVLTDFPHMDDDVTG